MIALGAGGGGLSGVRKRWALEGYGSEPCGSRTRRSSCSGTCGGKGGGYLRAAEVCAVLALSLLGVPRKGGEGNGCERDAAWGESEGPA